jgi:hypothetical protein
MKKLLQIAILLILTSTVHAQTTAWITQLNEEENFVAAGATKYFTVSKTPYNSKVYTVRSFNASGTPLLATTIFPNSPYTSMNIVKVLATPSDDLFVLANISDGITHRVLVIKLNSSLLQPWMSEISNGLKSYGKDIAIKGSNVIALTSFYPTLTGGTRASLTAFSTATGTTTQSVQPSFDFAPKRLTVDGNLNVYVCGGSELNLNQARAVKFNSSLVVSWNHLTTLSTSSTALTPYEYIATDVSGNVYVAGSGYNSTYSVFRNEVRKLNSAGTLVSSYSSTNINSHEILLNMKLTLSGSIIYVSKNQSTATSYAYHKIYKLSSTTPLTYQTSSSSIGTWPTSNVTLTGFEVTQGGAVMMTGYRTGTSASTTNYLSLKLKSDWTLDFNQQLNNGRCNSLIKAIPGSFPNDEFVTTGVIGGVNMLIKYTGVAPKLTPDSEPSPVGEIAKLTCYPNPVNSTLTIEGITDLNAMKLVDISGKQYAIQTIDAAFDGTTYNLKIDVAHLTKGIYILSAVNNGKMENLKVVVDH